MHLAFLLFFFFFFFFFFGVLFAVNIMRGFTMVIYVSRKHNHSVKRGGGGLQVQNKQVKNTHRHYL